MSSFRQEPLSSFVSVVGSTVGDGVGRIHGGIDREFYERCTGMVQGMAGSGFVGMFIGSFVGGFMRGFMGTFASVVQGWYKC